MSAPLQPALFLDRDGVVNEEVGFLSRPEDVRWVPGIFSLIRTAQRLGYLVVVVTNQSGIARGLYTTEEFLALMVWMSEQVREHGGDLHAVYHCPFHPTDGLGPWRREHPDRKPAPGMLLRAAADHRLDLRRSILVGDRCTDIAAARAAGLRQAFLLRGTGGAPCRDSAIEIEALVAVERWLKENADDAGKVPAPRYET